MDRIVCFYFVKKCGKAYENLNCRYEGVKFDYLSDFLASCRYDFIAKIFMSADARMARKLNSGTFDVKQYAEHPPVIHLCLYINPAPQVFFCSH